MLGRDPPRRHPVWHDGQRACERKIAKSTLHRIVHCTGSGRIRWHAESSTGRTGHRIRENQYQAGHQTGPDSSEYRFGNVAPDRTSLFVAFLFLFVFPRPSPPWEKNSIAKGQQEGAARWCLNGAPHRPAPGLI